MATKRQRQPKVTECGHGRVLNPCSISTPPFVACQGCARSVMIGDGGLVMAVVPGDAIPAPGGSLTLHRNSDGAWVYRAPACPSPRGEATPADF